MTKERVVCVEWEDATYDSGYYDGEKHYNYAPVLSRTVGFLIKRDKIGVYLAMEHFFDRKGKLDSRRHIETIPHKMIKKVVELGEVKNAKGT